MGGEFRFDQAGVMETVEDGFNVYRYQDFAGVSYVISFEGYSAKFCTSPILMHSFIICEQGV